MAAPAGVAVVGLGAAEPCHQRSAIQVTKVRSSVRSPWSRSRSRVVVAPWERSRGLSPQPGRVGSQVDEKRADGATGRTPGAVRS